MNAFDESGWIIGKIGPTNGGPFITLFTASAPAKIPEAELDRAARDLCGASISIEPKKTYLRGAAPLADVAFASVEVPGLEIARILVRTYPVTRGPEQKARALESAKAIGGAGMDWLVIRATRIIELAPAPGATEAHLLVVAFALATADLAAIHPAEGGSVFGPKTAREKLGKLGVPLR